MLVEGVDDIFDGWLIMSHVGSFLEEKEPFNRQSASPAAESQGQDNSGFVGARPENGPSQSDTPGEVTAQRKRRGHTKSRLGCISCKRRKIKCQEQWPSCANCIKRGCPCRYPTVFKHMQHDQAVSEVMRSAPQPPIRLVDTPKMYSANDMRLFHHYLIAAHPCIPHEYEAIWVSDIPCFSHQYDYLMDAILAVSGSHLSLIVDDPRGNMALSHRQRAITGLEEAFTRWPPKAEEAHVMLATSYLLAFQSSYMPDGFLDHTLSLRGCALISQMILQHRLQGTFTVDPNMHIPDMELKLRNLPALDQLLARDALVSLGEVASLLSAGRGSDIERALFAQLVECIRPLLVPEQVSTPNEIPSSTETESGSVTAELSGCPLLTVESSNPHIKNPLFPDEPVASFETVMARGPEGIATVDPDHRTEPLRSFNALMSSLLILATWPQGDVLHLFSQTNKLGNVILAHFCAVRFIVAPLSCPPSAMRTPVRAMIEWCERLLDAVEDDEEVKWTRYIQWPSRILRTLRCCVNQKRGLMFGDIYDILMKDPGAFREGRLRSL